MQLVKVIIELHNFNFPLMWQLFLIRNGIYRSQNLMCQLLLEFEQYLVIYNFSAFR
jgi:hypothetical protein